MPLRRTAPFTVAAQIDVLSRDREGAVGTSTRIWAMGVGNAQTTCARLREVDWR